jgi:mitogen-activated protein kinase 1/3
MTVPISAPVKLTDDRNVFTVLSTKFEVPNYYEILNPVGYGAYGFVVAALDTRTGARVAIKKSSRIFRDLADCKRTTREILVLNHLKHENLVQVRDFYLPLQDGDKFSDVYMVSDLMDTNLYSVIRSTTQTMNDTHYKFFIYQLLRGLMYLHSAGVIHRDLKPANILVNINCDLQICDFGLARPMDRDTNMTDYVVTRYYRPPELLLMCQRYTMVVDTWSVGCITAELMTRRTLFKGSDYIQQLDMILHMLRPTAEALTFLDNPQAEQHVITRCEALRESWGPKKSDIVPEVTDPLARDFLSQMLVFDPRKRATAAQLLEHPYLAELHDCNDEPVASEQFGWAHENEPMSEPLLRGVLQKIAKEFAEKPPAAGPVAAATPPATPPPTAEEPSE